MNENDYVKDGDCVLVNLNDDERFLLKVQSGTSKRLIAKKTNYLLDPLIGVPWGSVFEFHSNKLCRVTNVTDLHHVETDEILDETVNNNSKIFADLQNQNLSADEILKMNELGKSGDEIINALKLNSNTYDQKNKFSKEKWLLKKKKKYLPRIRILKPTPWNICELYFKNRKDNIRGLRSDTLSQIISYGNIKYNSNVLLVDDCMGIIACAILERLTDEGNLFLGYEGQQPTLVAYDWLNFTISQKLNLLKFSLGEISKIENNEFDHLIDKNNNNDEEEFHYYEDENDTDNIVTEEEEKYIQNIYNNKPDWLKKWDEVGIPPLKKRTLLKWLTYDEKKLNKNVNKRIERHILKTKKPNYIERRKMIKNGVDTIILASKARPITLINRLLQFLKPSSPFVIYSEYIEPLVECMHELKKRGDILNIEINGNWLRYYQILPKRTHPEMQMNHSAGYILYGIKILPNDNNNNNEEENENENEKEEEEEEDDDYDNNDLKKEENHNNNDNNIPPLKKRKMN